MTSDTAVKPICEATPERILELVDVVTDHVLEDPAQTRKHVQHAVRVFMVTVDLKYMKAAGSCADYLRSLGVLLTDDELTALVRQRLNTPRGNSARFLADLTTMALTGH